MFFDPILSTWRDEDARLIAQYAAGTWGPKDADQLVAKDGRQWRRL
jgi:glucose-6-phosphate 1-dehydrogenase